MLIEYVATKSRREVSESIGAVLIARKIARPVYQTRQIEPEPPIGGEISARTGKPKRQYKRRDMSAED